MVNKSRMSSRSSRTSTIKKRSRRTARWMELKINNRKMIKITMAKNRLIGPAT